MAAMLLSEAPEFKALESEVRELRVAVSTLLELLLDEQVPTTVRLRAADALQKIRSLKT